MPVDLQAVRTSLDTRMKSTQETLVDTRKGLEKELGLMFQVEAHTTKILIEANRRDLQTQLKEVEARAERRRVTGTGEGAAKPPKFDRTTSWAVFRRQFDIVAQHNCWTRLEKFTCLITSFAGPCRTQGVGKSL
jgi:hypothetical protein